MQACRRSLAPRELNHELLWLAVSLGGAALLAVWFALRWPTPQCFFRALTGLPCLTCGATRAAHQFLHGHFAASFFFNPLAFLLFFAVLIFDLYAAVVLVTRAPRIRFQNFSPVEKRLVRSVVLGLLAANWLYLLAAHIA